MEKTGEIKAGVTPQCEEDEKTAQEIDLEDHPLIRIAEHVKPENRK